jgi:sigma-B regulation protein RsbU (phosphoserine phosphatase)
MMEKLLELAPFFFFAISEEGHLTAINDNLCRQLGYNADELKGQKVETIFTVATKIFYQTHFFPLLKMQGHTNEIFVSLQTKEKQEIPVILNAETKEIDGKKIHLYAGMQVSNRKKFEEELIAAKRAAESALLENTALIEAKTELDSRLHELDRQMMMVRKQSDELKQFNRIVTHELQEPLRKLSIFISLILEQDEKAAQKKVAERLSKVSDQMRTIISGLQQYIWLNDNSNSKTDVDLDEIISEVREELNKNFPGVEVLIETSGLPHLYADRTQMKLLFYQLSENAVRFRKDEQYAAVKIVGNRLMRNRFRTIEGKYQYAAFFRIQVIDEGIGFPAEFRERAFGLFQRLHKKSGRGLGLALCKKVVDNHHGNISIDSMPEEGTTVTIFLPEEADDGMKNEA